MLAAGGQLTLFPAGAGDGVRSKGRNRSFYFVSLWLRALAAVVFHVIKVSVAPSLPNLPLDRFGARFRVLLR
jgi:hypothetical protein